jgi:hypothetical protein
LRQEMAHVCIRRLIAHEAIGDIALRAQSLCSTGRDCPGSRTSTRAARKARRPASGCRLLFTHAQMQVRERVCEAPKQNPNARVGLRPGSLPTAPGLVLRAELPKPLPEEAWVAKGARNGPVIPPEERGRGCRRTVRDEEMANNDVRLCERRRRRGSGAREIQTCADLVWAT